MYREAQWQDCLTPFCFQSGAALNVEGGTMTQAEKNIRKGSRNKRVDSAEKNAIPLDIFRNHLSQSGIRTEQDAWLAFLSSDEPAVINEIITKYPDIFFGLYEKICDLCRNTEEVMKMFSKDLEILDKYAVISMIEEQRELIESQQEKIDSQQEKIASQQRELEELRRKLAENG